MSIDSNGCGPLGAGPLGHDRASFRAPAGRGQTAAGRGAITTEVRVLALEQELDQLRQALASRAPIEQAKGILMYCYGLDADQAFAVLVRWSQTVNVKLRDVATAVVDVVCDAPDVRDRIGALEAAVLRSLDGESWRSSTPA